MSKVKVKTLAITLPCGFTIAGNDREINGKAKIHRKYCKTCILCHTVDTTTIPDSGKTIGKSRRGRLGNCTTIESDVEFGDNEVIKSNSKNAGNM